MQGSAAYDAGEECEPPIDPASPTGVGSVDLLSYSSAPFALHTLLSDSHGYLANAYIASPDDDHPNNYSGEVVGSAIAHHLETVLGYAQ